MAGKLKAVAAAAVLVGMGMWAASASSASSRLGASTVVHVIEHATTDTVIDTGGAGDTSGDLLTFHNDVYDATDTSVAGRDQGDCIRIDPAKGTWECRWTTRIESGSLTVEGPFSDFRNTTLAVTGGTGIYADARGEMDLRYRNGGTEFDFVFRLDP